MLLLLFLINTFLALCGQTVLAATPPLSSSTGHALQFTTEVQALRLAYDDITARLEVFSTKSRLIITQATTSTSSVQHRDLTTMGLNDLEAASVSLHADISKLDAPHHIAFIGLCATILAAGSSGEVDLLCQQLVDSLVKTFEASSALAAYKRVPVAQITRTLQATM